MKHLDIMIPRLSKGVNCLTHNFQMRELRVIGPDKGKSSTKGCTYPFQFSGEELYHTAFRERVYPIPFGSIIGVASENLLWRP